MKIIVIRHAKPKVLNNNFFEAHLSEESVTQTKQMALSGELPKPDVIFTSPYNRTIETARALCQAFSIDYKVKDFLKDLSLQTLSLLDPEYSIETRTAWSDHTLCVRGGESLNDVEKRAYEGLIQVASTSTVNTILFVSHGAVMELLCSRIIGRPAVWSNVENMKFLAYVVFEFKDGELRPAI